LKYNDAAMRNLPDFKQPAARRGLWPGAGGRCRGALALLAEERVELEAAVEAQAFEQVQQAEQLAVLGVLATDAEERHLHALDAPLGPGERGVGACDPEGPGGLGPRGAGLRGPLGVTVLEDGVRRRSGRPFDLEHRST
jgi:hypothetical protein